MDDDLGAAVDSALGAPPAAAAQPDDPMGAAVDNVISMDRARTSGAIRSAVGVNPDQAAKAKAVARRSGMPQDVVLRNLPEMEQEDMAKRIEAVSQRSDVMGSMFRKDPAFGQIAHDDTDNLTSIEVALREMRFGGRTAAAGLISGGAGLYGVVELGARLLSPLGELAPGAAEAFGGNARLGGSGNLFADIGNYFQGLRQGTEQLSEDVAGPLPAGAGIIRRGVRSGIQSIGQQAPGLIASIMTGNPAFSLGSAGLMTGGQSATKALDIGKSPIEALIYGASDAGVEIWTEMLPMTRLLGDLKAGSSFVKTLGHQVLAEVPGEQVATLLLDLTVWAVIHPEKTINDYIEERPAAALETLIATMVGVGAQTGAAHAAVRAAERFAGGGRKAEEAERGAAAVKELDKLAAASKVRQRDSETFEQFIAAATEDGPMQDVYISGEALMQTGLAEQLAQVSPAVAQQLAQAVAGGGDIRIPITEYTSKILGTELSAPLITHLKTSENAYSQSEAKEYLKEQGERLKGEVERVLGESAQTQQVIAGRDAVQARIVDKLNATQKFTPDVNAVYATQMANFFAVQAGRVSEAETKSGRPAVTPESLFAKYEPRIVAEGVAGQSLAQVDVSPGAVTTYSLGPSTVDYSVSKDGRRIDVSMIRTPTDQRGQGNARKALEAVIAAADANGQQVVLTAEAMDSSTSKAKLEKFYKSLGFKPNKGRSKDFTTTAGMVREPAQRLNQFAGQTAQHAPRGLLKHAERLLEAGQDAEAVRQQTGWALGADGEWRFEISDDKASLPAGAWKDGGEVGGKPMRTMRGTLFGEGGLLQHDDLLSNYPQLADLKVEILESEGLPFKVDAKYDHGKRAIEIWVNPARGGDALSTLLHEVQHAVQAIEGFSRGGGISESVSEHKYLRLVGEAEARNTQTRQAMTAAERRATPPGATLDVPADELTLSQGGAKPNATFSPDTRTIALLKGANLTSFLHESAHFYLEVLADLARTTPAIREDMDATLKWFGIEGDENLSALDRWNALPLKPPEGGGPSKEPYHEQWARGFEAWLFEGRSPSPEMQGIFQRFRAWMTSVYKSVKALNVDLTDEVRGVFDRLLATPTQIEAAQASRDMGLMFANEEEARKFGVDWAGYQAQGRGATDAAVADLDKRSLADMKWMSNARSKALRALQRQAKELRIAVTDEVTAEVDASPTERARRELDELSAADPATVERLKEWTERRDAEAERARDKVKAEILSQNPELTGLERAQLINSSKAEIAAAVERDLRAWDAANQKPQPAMTPLDFDAVAETSGFTSGDEMLRALAEAPRRSDLIAAMTDQRMLEQYGDITSPETIELAADEAVHNDMRQRVVATELSALEKAAKVTRTAAKAAKQFARDLVAGLKIRDLRPAQYAAAAARAGVASMRALKKNDIAEAAKQKRGQLIQGYAAKAATQAQGEVDAGLAYLRKVENSKSIDPDYRDQIDTILERFDLKRGTSLKTIDKRKALSAWIAEQEDLGIAPDLPADVKNEALRKSYKDTTVDEFRGLIDSVRQIEHLGRLKKRLLTAKDKNEFEAARDELVASITANAGGRIVDNRTRDTLMSGAMRLFKGFFAAHRKTASLAKELDGFKDGGPMWEYLIRTMNEAGDQEAVGREKATMALTALLKPILKGPKLSGKGQFFPSLGLSLNRGERLVMALNSGNAGNLQRLLDGRGWAQDQIQPALDTLTEQDWQFVQGVWDFFEGYRPAIAEKERRVMGREPDWIEATPVVTQFGTLRGGYYPIVYDPRESGRAENFANAEEAKRELKGAFVAATTRRSFTKTRSETVRGRPLLLTMDALFNGANEVVHDLSWHEWVIDANRILRNDQIDEAIRSGYGAETVASLKQAVKDIAAGEAGTVDAFTRVLTPLRAGAVIAGLGFNLSNAMLQPLGLTQSMVRVGTRWVALGIGEWAKSPVGLVRKVHEKSDFMRLRHKTQQRELNEISSLVKGKSATRAKLDALMFMPMTSMQLVADMPTWWGAYQKALAGGNQEERSIELADQAVIDAQGAGQVKDLSAIQRGHPLLKLFTTFYGFFNVSYNLGVERAKATNFRSPLDVMHLAWDFLLLYSVPAALATLLKEALTGGDGDDDDEEKLARKVLDDQISFLMGQMIGLRELTGALQFAAGTKQFNTSYGGPAGLRFAQELDKLGKQIGQGELDRALFRAGINVAGVTLHLPSGQLNRMVDGVLAVSEGKIENPAAYPAALLFGPPKP